MTASEKDETDDTEDPGLLERLSTAVHLELVNFHPLQNAVTLAFRAIPLHIGNRLRASALRVYGIDVGKGTVVYGPPEIASQLGPREHRAGLRIRHPVVIEDGAWIGARSVILPGVTIGAGAVVDAGSTVNKSVAPNTRVRGTPAKVVEELAP